MPVLLGGRKERLSIPQQVGIAEGQVGYRVVANPLANLRYEITQRIDGGRQITFFNRNTGLPEKQITRSREDDHTSKLVLFETWEPIATPGQRRGRHFSLESKLTLTYSEATVKYPAPDGDIYIRPFKTTSDTLNSARQPVSTEISFDTLISQKFAKDPANKDIYTRMKATVDEQNNTIKLRSGETINLKTPTEV